MRRLVIAVAASVVVAAGCGRGEPAPPAAGEAEGSVVGEGLANSLNVRVQGDTVRFTLLSTNAAGTARVLEFSTAQRSDFSVETTDGAVVWQWSAGMGFAQVLGADTVAAGATRAYEAEWTPGGRTGRHIAVGRVTSTNSPVELRTEFEIPER